GDIGQAVQAEHALDERVVAIVALVAKFAIAEEEMDDQEQDHDVMAEDRVRREVAEAVAQALLEAQPGVEGLEEHQPAEGGQGLGLEPQGGDLMESAMDGGSAIFHVAVVSV